MEKEQQKAIVRDIYTDISSHRLASEIIRSHSSNYADIRCVALDPLDLSQCRDILDIGCGFGFFTEALQGRVHPNAAVMGIDVIPDCEGPYLETCSRSGLKGSFLSEGLVPIGEFNAGSFDLILCGYAMYFFPEVIPEISRILRASGRFVTITHNGNHMFELIETVKEILRDKAMLHESQLPIESIIGRFSSENGENLLSPWFAKINRIDYHNTLTFRPDDISALSAYFRFKGAFFLSQTSLDKNEIAALLITRLQSGPVSCCGFTMSKDDTVFICSEPVGRK